MNAQRSLLPALLLLLFCVGCSSKPSTNSTTPTKIEEAGAAVSTRTEQIRGNKRTMIYHWPGCPYYDAIAPNNIEYFKTRAEAEAAGYRAARNCN